MRPEYLSVPMEWIELIYAHEYVAMIYALVLDPLHPKMKTIWSKAEMVNNIELNSLEWYSIWKYNNDDLFYRDPLTPSYSLVEVNVSLHPKQLFYAR